MAVLRPFSKLPELNSAVLLLVGSEGDFQQKLAEAILQEKKDFTVNVWQGELLQCRHECCLETGRKLLQSCAVL